MGTRKNKAAQPVGVTAPDTLDWADCLRDLEATIERGQDGAATVAEISAATGRCNSVIRRLLAKAISCGSVECVRVRRRKIDGIMLRIPAYKPTPFHGVTQS